MMFSPKNRDELVAKGWISYHKSPSNIRDENSEYFVFIEELSDSVKNDFSFSLRVVSKIIELCNDEDIIFNVAAGPMEDILVVASQKEVDEIIAIASRSCIFRKMLRGVWRNSIPDETWRRVSKIAGISD